MTPEELRQTLSASGWTCRVQRDEVVLEICYFCGNEKFNLELNAEKGVFHCWVCKEAGRLDGLLRRLTGQDHHIPVRKVVKEKLAPTPEVSTEFQSKPVAEIPSAAMYLNKRGISPLVAAQYGIVVCTQAEHRLEGRIAFPARDYWTGGLMGWVGRSYTGKNPKYLSTLTRKVITGWRQRDRDTPAVLVEGPLDGLAAHRAGFQAAVLGGTGGSGVIEWACRLPPKAPVAILLDGDAVQQATQLYWQLFPLRSAPVVIVRLPNAEDDPASLGVLGVGQVVRQALSASAPTA